MLVVTVCPAYIATLLCWATWSSSLQLQLRWGRLRWGQLLVFCWSLHGWGKLRWN